MVECDLAKVEVAGSNPVSRSQRAQANVAWALQCLAPYPSGKGEVCKTFMHRFESDRRLLVDWIGLTFVFSTEKLAGFWAVCRNHKGGMSSRAF